MNVARRPFALYTVWLATQPADESHPYGHGKAEAFSAVFEGGLIVLAASAILWAALPALWSPAPLAHLDLGLLLVAVTGAANLAVGRFLVRRGRETRSMALEADGRHLLSDSMTTGGVIAGLAVVRLTGWLWVDGLVAITVAVVLLRMGAGLVRRAVANLMDRADPEALGSIAGALLRARRPVMIEVHNLRSWRGGDVHHVDFHLTLPRFLELEQSHGIIHEVEAAVREILSDEADVIIHLDPCVPDCCQYCGYEPCPVRASPRTGQPDWSITALLQPAVYQRASGPSEAA